MVLLGIVLAAAAVVAAIVLLPAEAAAAAVVLILAGGGLLLSPSPAYAAPAPGVPGTSPEPVDPEVRALAEKYKDLLSRLLDPEGEPLTKEELERLIAMQEELQDILDGAGGDPSAQSIRELLDKIEAEVEKQRGGASPESSEAASQPSSQPSSAPTPGKGVTEGKTATTQPSKAGAEGPATSEPEETRDGLRVLPTTDEIPAGTTSEEFSFLIVRGIDRSTPASAAVHDVLLSVWVKKEEPFGVSCKVKVLENINGTVKLEMVNSWWIESLKAGVRAGTVASYSFGP
jgi:hypothetical protein